MQKSMRESQMLDHLLIIHHQLARWWEVSVGEKGLVAGKLQKSGKCMVHTNWHTLL